MATTCSCNVGFGNSKVPGCQPIASVAHGLIFVPTFDSTGARNQIDLTSTLNTAYFDALIAQSDQSKRWRPFTSVKMQNVKLERGESQYETFDSGDQVFIQSGDKKFTAVLPRVSPSVIKFFDSGRCNKISAFVVDVEGNLIGNAGTDGYLRPFEITDQSIDAREIPAQDKSSQKIEVRFTFAKTEEDGDIGMITASELAGVDPRTFVGLYDVSGIFSSITTTGFVVDLRTHYGTPLNPIRCEGLVKADFVLTNRGTGATITITTTTENAVTPGKYTFVIPSQTSGHTLKLTFTKAGFNSDELGSQIITIP